MDVLETKDFVNLGRPIMFDEEILEKISEKSIFNVKKEIISLTCLCPQKIIMVEEVTL